MISINIDFSAISDPHTSDANELVDNSHLQ